ncbi:S8/S53 family peptidase [Archangium violaceum]|uniref:S8/S53 family peptidase n=1 Tax=Archangium violaceum TaxID=83451 RepID=UPI00193C7BC8|nr:S8/S53 family peptidase [Archangium violaceum]QRK07406.1 S8/S53 family peptidase [Archangium violaceum]
MKVGIIDSGVEVKFLREHALGLAGGARFTLDLDAQVLETRSYDRDELEAWRDGARELDLQDEHGHGTAVLSILYDRVRPWPDVELYVARIFDQEVRGYSLCLVEALRWMLDEVGVELLNLSLGTTHRALEAPMREVIDRAVARGAIIACAAGGVPTLPAQLESVVAVGDPTLMDRVGSEVKVDHVVRERGVKLYMGGSWCEAPMTTSFACAVAVAGVLRDGCPPGWRRKLPLPLGEGGG